MKTSTPKILLSMLNFANPDNYRENFGKVGFHPFRKFLLSLAFCFALMSARAQYVTIPDSNFVNWLNGNGYAGCMNGNQMDTTCGAVVNAITVNCTGAGIVNLSGIEYFDNLGYLICGVPWNSWNVLNHDALSVIPKLPPLLYQLSCNNNSLTSLPNLPSNLRVLECSINYLTSLPSLPADLDILRCGPMSYYNGFPQGSLTTLPALPNSLTELTCTLCGLTSLPALPYSLQILQCPVNFLTTLPSLPSPLYWLNCENNQLTDLPALPPSITNIRLYDNNLHSLPALPSSITYLDIGNNPNLICLPGISYIGHFEWNYTGITCFPNNFSVGISNPPITNIPICDFWNTNGCGIFKNINGWVYSDANNNCIPDNNESVLRNVKLNLFQNGVLKQQAFSNYQGYYSFGTDTGTFNYSVDTTIVPSTISCPLGGFYTSSITPVDSMDFDRNFSLECLSGFDLGTKSVIRKWGVFRPGQQVNINILSGDLSGFFGLHCASGISGNVRVTITGPVSYLGPSPGALNPIIINNSLVYFISDFASVNMKTAFGILLNTDTLAQAFQNICIQVVVTPNVGGDNNTANNNYTQCFTVTNSYDPNEKEVSPSGSIDTTQRELTYTIYFQNTGNDTALHVYVLDTLDNAIDESSIQLLAYSHEPLVQVMGKVIKFNFPNINLVDSTTDEPNSHGYVQYRVRIKDNAVVGTQIHNTAFIYFDFNAPVVTNTTVNQIDVITGLTPSPSPSERGTVTGIYPNPVVSGGELKVLFSSPLAPLQRRGEPSTAMFCVFDMSGRKVFVQTIFSSAQTQGVRLPFFAPGIYQCVMEYGSGCSRHKLVVGENGR